MFTPTFGRMKLALGVLAIVAAVAAAATCPRLELSRPQILKPETNPGLQRLFFGQYIKTSGIWMVVGAYGQRGWRGAAHIYRRQGDRWEFFQEIEATNAKPNLYFGLNLAIARAFGRPVIVVGAPFDTPFGRKSGSARVFDYVFRNGKWRFVETQLLKAPGRGLGHILALYGYSIAMQGNFLAVGSRGQNKINLASRATEFIKAGAVYIYKRGRRGAAYQLQNILFGPRPSQQFSDELRLTGFVAGTGPRRVLVGAPRNRPNEHGAAYVYIFNKGTGKWRLEQQLVPDETGLRFANPTGVAHYGEGLSLSSDPISIVLGGERAPNDKSSKTGAAYVYERKNGRWRQTSGLYPDLRAVSFFGQRLQRFKKLIAVGAWQYPTTKEKITYKRSGAAFIFVRCSDGSWSNAQILSAAVRKPGAFAVLPQEGGEYGKMVDVTSDFIAVGGPKMDSGNPGLKDRGVVYMYKYKLVDGGSPSTPDSVTFVKNFPSGSTRLMRLQYCPGKKMRCPATRYVLKEPGRVGCVLIKNGSVLRSKFTPNRNFPPLPANSRGTIPNSSLAAPEFTIPSELSVGERVTLSLRIFSSGGGVFRAENRIPVKIIAGTTCNSSKLLQFA